jgi:hypothetical protein
MNYTGRCQNDFNVQGYFFLPLLLVQRHQVRVCPDGML